MIFNQSGDRGKQATIIYGEEKMKMGQVCSWLLREKERGQVYVWLLIVFNKSQP